MFEPDRVIEKQVKAAAKFLSAEEEAEQRRLELLSFKAKSVNGNSIDTESGKYIIIIFYEHRVLSSFLSS